MKAFIAFTRKELLEQIRSGRLLIMGALFLALGIMNPAVAKLTPWLLELFADSLAGSGITVTETTVSALDSWAQFFKNIPIGLIAFVLLQSSVLAKEVSSGALILSLTKGLQRYKAVVSKSTVLCALWTIGYFICFGVTYAYNSYFWDNSVAHSLGTAILCWWLFGMLVISFMILFSVLSLSATGVLMGTGGVVLVFYLVGLMPRIGKYLPTKLMDGSALIYGIAKPSDYYAVIIIASALAIACFIASIPIFNKKHL